MLAQIIPLMSTINKNSIIEIDYHIGAGQSNMAGRMESSSLVGELAYLSGEMTLNGNTAYITNKAINPTTYDIMEAGVNTSDAIGMVGIQSEVAYNMLSYTKKDFNYIQSAYGGTPLLNYRKGSENFNWIMQKAKQARVKAKSEGKIARFKSMTWIQGESNGGDFNGAYENTLRDLIKDYRIYLKEPDMKFIVVQMIDCQTGVSNLSQLQSAQEIIGNESNNALINKTGISQSCRDPLHFSDQKYLLTGYEVFNIIKDL